MAYDLSKIEFSGEKRYLSNMYPTSILFNKPILLPDEIIEPTFLTYASSEHLYQACKSEALGWHKMLLDLTPEKTKTKARKALKTLLANNVETFLIRDNFHDIKVDVMTAIVSMKFDQNKVLAEKLLAEEGLIEERNCWNDRFWGTVEGTGLDHLGRILRDKKNQLKNRG